MWLKSFNWLKEAIFPTSCVGCGRGGRWLCVQCERQTLNITRPTCPYCGRLTARGKLCPRCRGKSNLTGLVVAGYYREGPLKEAICAFKYEFVQELLPYLSALLVRALKNSGLPKHMVLVPLPLSFWRRLYRGFNQGELLAEAIAKKTGRQMDNCLGRVGERVPQVDLPDSQRRKNVQGVFRLIKKPTFKRVILVDDVFTTGATMEEAAKVLREAGVREVWGLVLAKG